MSASVQLLQQLSVPVCFSQLLPHVFSPFPIFFSYVGVRRHGFAGAADACQGTASLVLNFLYA
jgi:hypothetical protein